MMEYSLQKQVDEYMDEDLEYRFREIGEYRSGPIVLQIRQQVDFVDVFRQWARDRWAEKLVLNSDLRGCKSLMRSRKRG